MSQNYRLRDSSLLRVFQVVLLIAIAYLTTIALIEYKGEAYIYLLFTILSSVLLYCGFRRNAIFFDTFIGIFLWLGFWLKLTVRVAFMGSEFDQAVGAFDGGGDAFDEALVVSCYAFAGLIVASWLREKLLFVYPQQIGEVTQQGLFCFYKKYRLFFLFGFLVLISAVAITNLYFGIYQRGSVTRTFLPYGLNGIYKWLLLFGLASISALILKFEYIEKKKTSYLAAFVALLECFASNVSLLSRGMILNSGALIYGAIRGIKLYQIKSNLRHAVVCLVVFLFLFGSSVFAVNYIRADAFHTNKNTNNTAEVRVKRAVNKTSSLFLDRWVGIEGVMAVSSYSDKGWPLWKEALQEKYSENRMSFYDANLIDSPYKNKDWTKHHFISLPGVIAFCFYPGSYIFLLFCMFAVGIVGSLIEIFVFKLGGKNVFLCALLAQVVAYRFASFGYVPAQSYLLFGTLIFNVVIIYMVDKFLTLSSLRKMLRLQ